MEWKNIKDELPPIGKKLLIECSDRLQIVKLGYLWQQESGDGWPKVCTKEELQSESLHWFLIPERKK